MGASILTNSITVNNQPTYRNQEYFRQQIPANNTNSALWTNITVSGGQVVSGNVYVPQQPENFQYDADGNLTNDGRWQYVWDAENRLIAMIVNTNIGPQYTLTFAYDPEGRRISKAVSTNGVGISTNIFLYDGWNLVATLSPSDALINSFMWGPDLSGQTGGAFNGAGGVGGLLEATYYGTSTTNCFPAYDGNGNIMALVNAANGQIVANYEYGPFGEVIRQTGPMAKGNPFRFSTKYQDDESDLLYYGYRYYKASTGTWPNRDPLGEPGFETVQRASPFRTHPFVRKPAELIEGPNLYNFVANNPVNRIDPLGLWQITITFGDIIGFRFTFGNNGGTGLFNGQWNQGVQVGLGEGASFDLDTTSSGCHKKNSFVKGFDLSGDIGLGPHVEGHTHYGDDPSWDINFGVPHTFAGGQIGSEGASAPTLSFGESLFGGYGGTRYY